MHCVFNLRQECVDERIMQQHARYVGKPHLTRMMPSDEWFEFSIHKHQGNLCEQVITAEYDVPNTAMMTLDIFVLNR